MGRKIKILYNINTDVQKQLILENKNSARTQLIEVEAQEYPELLDRCSITDDGDAILDTADIVYDCDDSDWNIESYYHYQNEFFTIKNKCFDTVMTASDISMWIKESDIIVKQKLKNIEQKKDIFIKRQKKKDKILNCIYIFGFIAFICVFIWAIN